MRIRRTIFVASTILAAFLPAISGAQTTKEQQARAAKEERLSRERRTAEERRRTQPERREARIEVAVRKQFHTRPRAWLEGIKLTGDQRRQVEQIQRQTQEQLRAIGRDVDAREENGKPIGVFKDRVVDLMQNEQGQIRNVLNESQRVRFDRNVSQLKTPW